MSSPALVDLVTYLLRRHRIEVGIIVAFTAVTVMRPVENDWDFYSAGIQQLLGNDRWQLYADQPSVQIGPLGLVAASALPGETAAQYASLMLLLPAAVLVDRRFGRGQLLPILLLSVAWAVASLRAQPADLLVIVLALLAADLVGGGRAGAAAVLIGLAIGTKPWALGLTPMILCGSVRRAFRHILIVVALSIAVYAPFLVHSGSWTAASPQMGTNLGSVYSLFGNTPPAWTRGVQLVACLGVATLAAIRGGTRSVLLATAATRLLLDPSSYPYQALAPVAGALLWDGEHQRVRAGWLGLLLLFASSQWLAVNQQLLAIGTRTALLAMLIVLSLCHPRRFKM